VSSFSPKRRIMLGGCAAIGIGVVLYRAFNGTVKETVNKKTSHQITLSSLVDTIVPADDFPGALDLKLDEKLFDSMKNSDKQRTNFQKLAESIDNLTLSTERKKFTDLSLDDRENLLGDILQKNIKLITRHNLMNLRHITLKWYYSTREGRQSLGYLLPSEYPAYQS